MKHKKSETKINRGGEVGVGVGFGMGKSAAQGTRLLCQRLALTHYNTDFGHRSGA